MLTEAFWKEIRHFKAAEFGAGSENLDPELLKELDSFRDFLGERIVVTSAFREGDSGEHGKGLALDVVFPDRSRDSLLDTFLAASRFKFRGIGVYSDWHLNGHVLGGLHLDMRLAPHRALWCARKGMDGKNVYVPLTLTNLRALRLA